MFVKGVNLGNWLVLEKWMSPVVFAGTTAEDEYYLPTQLSPEVYEARIRIHRAEYISERNFVRIKSMGLNTVRIPVPYFIFGDRPPFIGCVSELDNAFNWAEKYGIQILIDLHTAPDSQNGFDNGGICGVCKWSQKREEVDFELTVLERLAERYGARKGLWGIEIINEPVLEDMWEFMNVPKRFPAAESEKAKGSRPNTLEFIQQYYLEAYEKICRYMPEDKFIGCETALWLAKHEKKVTIVEALDKLLAMNGPLCSANKDMLERLIPYNNIEVVTGAKVTGYHNGILSATLAEGEKKIVCDSVILSVGYRENDTLYHELEFDIPEIYLLGDAKKVSNIMYGIWDAFEVANHI